MNLDYLAGHFDGEGSIVLRKRRGSVDILVTVSHTYLPVLQAYQETFGGGISPRKLSAIGRKPIFQWQLQDRVGVAKFLLLMENRLQEKRPRALEALAICTSRLLSK